MIKWFIVLVTTFMLLMSAFAGYVIYNMHYQKEIRTDEVKTAMVEFFRDNEIPVNCNP